MLHASILVITAFVLAGCSSKVGETQTVASSTTTAPETTVATALPGSTATTAPARPATSLQSSTTATTVAAQTKTVRLEQFQTPTKNISCDASGQGVRCDISQMSWPPIPQPAGCPDEWDWGNGFTIEAGIASVNCATDSVLNSGNPVLAYGEASTIGEITCVSRQTGLTCTHARTKHGFFMSRASYKLF